MDKGGIILVITGQQADVWGAVFQLQVGVAITCEIDNGGFGKIVQCLMAFRNCLILFQNIHGEGIEGNMDVIQVIQRFSPCIVGGGFPFPIIIPLSGTAPPCFGQFVREPYDEDDKTCKKGHFHI